MKNEVQIMPVNDIMSMSKMFVESGMFTDAKSVAQAFVKIQAGQEIGLAPFAAMSGINVIMGKPTFGAGIIASSVKSSGKYDFKVIEMSDKICSIDYFEGKEKIGNSTFTIEDAKKQGTKNLDKFPKNMLYARAMSNGQKWFCPDVFQMAVYVPEEMQETTVDVNHVEVIEPIEVKIPILSEKQLEKLLDLGVERIEANLKAITDKKLIATAEQIVLLQNKINELKSK
jgi:hypothetical protein